MKITEPKTPNLETVIIAAKCRKGKAHAIDKQGAYWLACEPIKTRAFGGDGIGQSAADGCFELELRHYRNGKTAAKLIAYSWHQNYGRNKEVIEAANTIHTPNVEDLIILLRNTTLWGREAISDYFLPELTEALTALGLPEYPIPSPDEEEAPPATA